MPHLLRLPRDLETRLDALAEATGLSKHELIIHCVQGGIQALEQRQPNDAESTPAETRSIDQVLRESGLGA